MQAAASWHLDDRHQTPMSLHFPCVTHVLSIPTTIVIFLLFLFAGGPSNDALTIATTHHSIMTGLKFDDGRVENASVEFDEEKLAPTYKLLWGIPGRSKLQVC
jgi:hypothetical protein